MKTQSLTIFICEIFKSIKKYVSTKLIDFCFILTVSTYSIKAQVKDTLSFIKSKKMMMTFLKNEGTS
jgi:hypothetical protein